MYKKTCWHIENDLNNDSYPTIKLIYINEYKNCSAKNIECKLYSIN